MQLPVHDRNFSISKKLKLQTETHTQNSENSNVSFGGKKKKDFVDKSVYSSSLNSSFPPGGLHDKTI